MEYFTAALLIFSTLSRKRLTLIYCLDVWDLSFLESLYPAQLRLDIKTKSHNHGVTKYYKALLQYSLQYVVVQYNTTIFNNLESRREAHCHANTSFSPSL